MGRRILAGWQLQHSVWVTSGEEKHQCYGKTFPGQNRYWHKSQGLNGLNRKRLWEKPLWRQQGQSALYLSLATQVRMTFHRLLHIRAQLWGAAPRRADFSSLVFQCKLYDCKMICEKLWELSFTTNFFFCYMILYMLTLAACCPMVLPLV